MKMWGITDIAYRIPCHIYEMEGIEPKHVMEENDLSVIMDQEFKCNRQTEETVKKANRMFAIINTSFVVMNVFTLPVLFKALTLTGIRLYHQETTL